MFQYWNMEDLTPAEPEEGLEPSAARLQGECSTS